MKGHLSERSSGNKKWMDGCLKIRVTHLHNLAVRLFIIQTCFICCSLNAACVQSGAQAPIISARLRRNREVQAVARGVRWPPPDRCWVTPMARPGVEEVEVSLRSATPNAASSHDIAPPPTTNCAPCCQLPACSSPVLHCFFPACQVRKSYF